MPLFASLRVRRTGACIGGTNGLGCPARLDRDLAMPKLKSHKGLLKRIKVTTRGKVKFRKSFNGHLRSHKTGQKIRHLRLKKLATPSDIKRMEKMLHRPLQGVKN